MKKLAQGLLPFLIIIWTTVNSTAAPSKSKYYYLQAKASKMNLSTQNSRNPGTRIVQKSGAVDMNKWRFISAGNNYYYIQSKQSGFYLQVSQNSNERGSLIIQFPFNGSSYQQWKLESAGDEYYYIRSRASGLYVDVQGGSKDSGATIWQYPLNRTDAQRWRLLNAGKVANINIAITANLFQKRWEGISLFGHRFNFGEQKERQPPLSIGRYGSNTIISGVFVHNVSFYNDPEEFFLFTVNNQDVFTEFFQRGDAGYIPFSMGHVRFRKKWYVELADYQMPQESKYYSDLDVKALYEELKSKFPNTSTSKAIQAISYIMAVYLYQNEQYLQTFRNRATLNGKRNPPMDFKLYSEQYPLPKQQKGRKKVIDHR